MQHKRHFFILAILINIYLTADCQKTVEILKLNTTLSIDEKFKVNKFQQSVFAEVLGDCIYDGIWVGKKSNIPNVDGIRKDFIEGCKDAGVTAIRWPGGCFADHYHWKYGVGANRKSRIYKANLEDGEHVSRPETYSNDFGTDEFIKLCQLIGCEPILVANTATGTPADFLDWFEYCNGDTTTFYGNLRAKNGHQDPYQVTNWALGNTDENVWHIASLDPMNYARDFLRFRTTILDFKNINLIGLGLSLRHNQPDWPAQMLDYVTRNQINKGPSSLSVHHYTGGMKYPQMGSALKFTDEEYYNTLNSVSLFQKDIDHHREVIAKHTNPKFKTTICFDEWGLWHPEADSKTGYSQPQPLRDGLFAALSLHTFYRNSDIVEYAMETQVANVLQSLFETRGAEFYKTPTFYVFKLLKDHLGQYLVPMTGFENETMLDAVMTISESKEKITLSIVNKYLYQDMQITLPEILKQYSLSDARIITAQDVRNENTFEKPNQVIDRPLMIPDFGSIFIEKHSVTRFVFQKK